MSSKTCPGCGRCSECGHTPHAPQVVPMPYPVYPYYPRPMGPWVSPYTQPFTTPQRWNITCGNPTSAGNYTTYNTTGGIH